jgi:hypothetical protein
VTYEGMGYNVIEAASTLPAESKLAFRAHIFRLQEHLLTQESALDQCPVRHIFAPGCYAREMTIPKGIVIIGKIHRHRHVNIISKGKVRVATEFGVEHFEAPYTFVSEVGTKRAVVALEDTVWTTIHVTDETDLDKIEDYVIAKDYDMLEGELLAQSLLDSKGEST